MSKLTWQRLRVLVVIGMKYCPVPRPEFDGPFNSERELIYTALIAKFMLAPWTLLSGWVTHSPTLERNITHPYWYLRGKCPFWLVKQYLCTGEHFESDLDILRFNLMVVKPYYVPSLLCFNVQTDVRFWLRQLPYHNAYPMDTGTVVIKISCQFAR